MKKIFRIITFCLIIFVIILCSDANSVFAINDNSSLYYENCNKSILIFNDVVQAFKNENKLRSGDLNNNYSDNYAGSYLDENGILNVGYVDDVNLPTYDNQVIYIKRNYSYNLLLEIQNAVTTKMIDYNVNSVSLDEQSNKVNVYLSEPEDANLLISYLRENNLYFSKAINIIIDAESELIPHKKTAYGGDKINDSDFIFLKSYGTICVNAYDNETGKYGVLTNAHVAESNTMMYHDGNILQGSKLGKATKRQHSGTIDAAFVPFESQDNWEVTTHARMEEDVYNNIKLGSRELIIQGAPVRRLGQTTGNTTGKLLSTNYTCRISYDGILTVITNTLQYSTNSDGGDSGGPVYFNGGGQNLYLIGMHFAGPIDPSVEYGIGCSIFNVMDEFNITPVLNGTMYDTTDLDENEIRIDKLNLAIPYFTDLNETQFVIPTYLNGRKVTEIGEYAFENQVNVTEFVLPAYLKTIGNSAFKNCSNLTNVIIPDTVTHIDTSAFEGCSYLQSITLSTNLIAIGSLAFKGCASLEIISIPNSVTHIDTSAFEGCSYLQSVTLSNNLNAIGTSAFKGCGSLERIVIPLSVQYIDDEAFKNCSSLSVVTVNRRISNITNLGVSVFYGCHANLQIVVPTNRIAEYKNKEYWSSYRNKITPSEDYAELEIDCEGNVSESLSLSKATNELYKLNVNCSKSYKINANSSKTINIIIYDANMNVISSGSNTVTQFLGCGTYYISFEFDDTNASGTFEIGISLTWTSSNILLNKGTNNIKNSMHLNNANVYHCSYKYLNNQGEGFYRFSLNVGSNIILPEGTIKIYSNINKTELLNRYGSTGINEQAITQSGENELYVFLPENGYYYIDVVLPKSTYSLITLTI